ncbi:TetR/AcrR family transcriptional regulator [Nocardioides panzhihuensis]|uniref:AcrR family transcriptional regulator n=1 Tax=Nocardioides panzhihuensis TaxID=860243 RepID=A0A7Z0DMT8_9ACTN|nr:TetR/AcrR family transcriptional regulator [Nocardioides panzhihuensis]NYI78539.1 AcrR family transcriptional regulator [Nocardioides panzhihuensis]
MPRPSVEAERKEQILAAACTVLADKGFTALRIADVAKEIGTSTGTVHYYFDTKRDLTTAAFEWNFARSLERRQHILDLHDDPRSELRAFVESYLPTDEETVRAWHVWAELWVEALHDAELARLNERVYGAWRTIVRSIIEHGQRVGHFRAGDPTSMANALISMIDGLSLQVLLGSEQLGVDQMRAVCDQALASFDVPVAT